MSKVVSVYGYGRFGKLWASLFANDFRVKVYSRRGLKPDEVDENLEIVSADEIFNCDAMFFCVSISALEQLLINSRDKFRKDTVYIDTCSVKVYPTQWMMDYLPPESQIIATHPMFGPDSYHNSKYKLPMVMCDIRTNNTTFHDWATYFSGKNMRIEHMTPDEHDKTVAYSQGITHYVGRVLADINLKPNRISTLGYNKLLDIIEQTCNDSWQLFIDLQKYNPYTKNMREELNNALQKIYKNLEFNNR
jgi:prephenate dehydrogenase